jgi:hypothetical protein
VLIYESVTLSCPVSQHITPLPAPFRNTPGKSKMDKWVKKIQADKTPRTLEVRVRERVRERAGQERALVLMLTDMLRVRVQGLGMQVAWAAPIARRCQLPPDARRHKHSHSIPLRASPLLELIQARAWAVFLFCLINYR